MLIFVRGRTFHSPFQGWFRKTRMAYSSVITQRAPPDLLNFLQSHRHTGPDYLSWVFNIVSTKKHQTYKLNSPAGATWTVGDLDDTIYKDDYDTLYAWGNFYLKKEVDMTVLGVVEGSPFPGEQLVLMTCEDRNIYAYDGDELHLVAPNLEQLSKEGIKFPPSVSYYYGEAFKDMTDKNWDEVRKGPVGRKLDEQHHKLVMGVKAEILSHLPAK